MYSLTDLYVLISVTLLGYLPIGQKKNGDDLMIGKWMSDPSLTSTLGKKVINCAVSCQCKRISCYMYLHVNNEFRWT